MSKKKKERQSVFKPYVADVDLTINVPVKLSVRFRFNACNRKDIEVALRRMAEGKLASEPLAAANTMFWPKEIGGYDCDAEAEAGTLTESAIQLFAISVADLVHGPFQIVRIEKIWSLENAQNSGNDS